MNDLVEKVEYRLSKRLQLIMKHRRIASSSPYFIKRSKEAFIQDRIKRVSPSFSDTKGLNLAIAFLSTWNGHLKFVQFHGRVLPMKRSRRRLSFNFSCLHGFQTYSYTERRFSDRSTSSIQTGILVWHMTIIFTFVFNFCQHWTTIPQVTQAHTCQVVDYTLPAGRRLLFPLLHAEKGPFPRATKEIGDVCTQANYSLLTIFLSTGSPSSKYEHWRISALLRNIRNKRICMGKKQSFP